MEKVLLKKSGDVSTTTPLNSMSIVLDENISVPMNKSAFPSEKKWMTISGICKICCLSSGVATN